MAFLPACPWPPRNTPGPAARQGGVVETQIPLWGQDGERAAAEGNEKREIAAFVISFLFHVAVILMLTFLMVDEPPRGGRVIRIVTSSEADDGLDDIGLPEPIDPEIEMPVTAHVLAEVSMLVVAAAAIANEFASLELPDVGTAAGNRGPAVGIPELGELQAVAAATGGHGARIEFYGVEAEGRDFVFVLDKSSSMAGAPFERLKQELRYAIACLPAEARFFVVFFDVGANKMTARGLTRASAFNKDHHLRWADTVPAYGGTDPSAALAIALRLQPTTVFLMTDGAFEPTNTLQVIGQLNEQRKVTINTIGVGTADAAVLRHIADENRGQFRHVEH